MTSVNRYSNMAKGLPYLLAALACPLWPQDVSAFRNCDVENSYAFSASTQYMVAEIVFDWHDGSASGTKTIYNYANDTGEGAGECHVTYELSGSYAPGSGTFVLDAHRTNASSACSLALLGSHYPEDRTYSFWMDFSGDGTVEVHHADNGDLFAEGSFEDGRTVYKTPERCRVF